MSDDEICGSTDTTSGEPCQRTGTCPWHDEDQEVNTRQTELEEHPEIVELIAGQLQNGDTVPEACAEANISEKQYYDWRRRGIDNPDTIFSTFREETAHARRIAGKRDREELKQACRDADDTRTWYKLHLNQYGDTYGDEDTDMRDGTEIVLHESAESYRDAIEQ